MIDSGFSFTHIVPVLRGRVVSHAVKRCVVWLSLVIMWNHALIDQEIAAAQDRRRREIAHQLLEGARLVPALVHDGSDERHGTCQGKGVLRLDPVGTRLGTRNVSLFFSLSDSRFFFPARGSASLIVRLAFLTVTTLTTRSFEPTSCPTLSRPRPTNSAMSAPV